MFGWFKKKADREIIKLLVQNASALDYLSSFDPDVSGQFLVIKAFQDKFNDGGKFPQEEVDLLLQMNMNLRHLYDEYGLSRVKSFDQQFTPLVGWQTMYERYGL